MDFMGYSVDGPRFHGLKAISAQLPTPSAFHRRKISFGRNFYIYCLRQFLYEKFKHYEKINENLY